MLPAVVGVALLWPRDLPPAPPHVPASAAFTPADIAHAHAYRAGVDRLLLGVWLAPVAAAGLVVLVRRRLRALRRPVWAAAVTGLAVSVAVLPFTYELHRRAVHAGLDLRSDGAWLSDALVSAAEMTVAVAVGYVVVAWLARRFGAVVAGLGLAAVVAVVVIGQPLAETSTHPVRNPAILAEADRLERTMGVHPDLVIAANGESSRAENAETTGVGPTAQVAIDETFARSASPSQMRALLAHELGHVQRHHILKGLVLFALLAVPAVALILRVVRRRMGMSLRDPATVPVVLFAVLLVTTLATPLAFAYSRRVEAEADWAGLRATRDGPGMAALQQHLALADLSDPKPPRWAVWLLFDHPPVMERIAVARAYSGSS